MEELVAKQELEGKSAAGRPAVAGLELRTQENDPYSAALTQLKRAAEILELSEGMHRMLARCKRELSVHFPVVMDDSRLEILTGCGHSPFIDNLDGLLALILGFFEDDLFKNEWEADSDD